MNRLKGKIELINSHDELLLIELNVQHTKIIAIIIGKPNDYSYLEIGNEIAILFKENEVTISTDKILDISHTKQINLHYRFNIKRKTIKSSKFKLY